ncbi:MAG: methyltransferase domain-containing protein [Proteobacteria bacterium]|nr:methyltransferase domain-containing protein [Pseudomonadota bacterium]
MVDWDKKYRNGYYDGATEPHDLLQKFWQVIPGKKVIDVAMGNGRDSIFLAKKGFCVYGLEKSMEAIRIAKETTESAGHPISIIHGDAATMPFKDNSADCVIVFYFLLRDIMRDIPDMLRKGGILIYETFLKRQNEVEIYTANTASERGRHHQRNPDYLLEDGELISFFRDFQLLFYEETISASMNNRRATAKFIGRKR